MQELLDRPTARLEEVLAIADGLQTECVYKPVRGERPLWDFPDGTLAGRETFVGLQGDWGTLKLGHFLTPYDDILPIFGNAPTLTTSMLSTAAIWAQNGIPWWYFHRHGGPFDGRRIEAVVIGGFGHCGHLVDGLFHLARVRKLLAFDDLYFVGGHLLT